MTYYSNAKIKFTTPRGKTRIKSITVKIDEQNQTATYFEHSYNTWPNYTKKVLNLQDVDLSSAMITDCKPSRYSNGFCDNVLNMRNKDNARDLHISHDHKVTECVIPKLGLVKVGDDLTFRKYSCKGFMHSKFYTVDSIHPLYKAGELTGEFFIRIGYKDDYNVCSHGDWHSNWVIGHDTKIYNEDLQELEA